MFYENLLCVFWQVKPALFLCDYVVKTVSLVNVL